MLNLEFLNSFFRKGGTSVYQLYLKITDIWKKVGLLTQKKPYLLRWDYLPKATWKTKVKNMTE